MNPWTWWFFFTVAAVYGQKLFPGTDLLSPGLLICLQGRHYKQGIVLGGLWMLIQEGTASVTFGSGVLFLVGLVVFYALGTCLLEPENPFFVLLVSAWLAVWRIAVAWVMLTLQELFIPPYALLETGLKQFVAFSICWGVSFLMYKQLVRKT